MNGENVQQNNLDNIYGAQLAQQRASDNTKKSGTKSAQRIGALNLMAGAKKLSEHWLILVVALLFDGIGLIPYVGIIANPIFSLILFLTLGSRSKGSKIAGGTVAGIIIESIPIINLLPTNTANAIFTITSK